MPLSNASRLADFGTGIGTAGAIIQVDNANQRLGVGTTAPTATLGVAGIVSATAFYGDGSNLDGVASAGLGTALSETEFDPLAVIYQTSDTLSVGATITVDPPNATTKVAYTQYAEVKLEGDADLIVAEGDDFIPDILGLSTEGAGGGAAYGNNVFNTVYTDNIEKVDGRGAPNFPKGINVSYTGVSTFTGNVSIGGTLTYEDVTNVDSIGLITARNGINVTGGGINAVGVVTASTGIDAASNLILKTGGTEQVRIASNGNVGIGTDDPQAELVVGNHNSGDTYIQVCNSTTGFDANSGFIIGLKADEGATLYQLENNYMRFGTNQQERLRIGADGQFGIGGANYGTTGQVLTSQGASAAPQWADAGGAGLEWVAGQSDPNSNYITFTGLTDTNVTAYRFVWSGITMNANASDRLQAEIQTSYDGGTWHTSNDYANKVELSEWNGSVETQWWDNSKNCIQFVGNEAGQVSSGFMEIPVNKEKVDSGLGDKYAYGTAINTWGTGYFRVRWTDGNIRLNTITGVRFKNNSGNLTGVKGRIDMYKYTQS